MIKDFEFNSGNPRVREEQKTNARTKIDDYNKGEASHREAFEAAYAVSESREDQECELGRALGGIVLEIAVMDPAYEGIIVYGLSPDKQKEIAEQLGAGSRFGYTFDVGMLAPNFQPEIGTTIENPIEAGFVPISKKAPNNFFQTL